MRLVYTVHARKRMLERGIGEKDVEFIISFPDSVEEGLSQALLAAKGLGGREIKIIYRFQDNKIIIITVY